jgi:tetratricopeptide (TPR) repeat protein
LRLRNAAFFKADCAFDLGEYETSIRLYDAAKERYPRDAASLVAMVQIVAALLEQGKTQEAATANVRARKFYESLPESAWDDPSLPMSRRQWEQWLDAQTALAGTPETQTAPGER